MPSTDRDERKEIKNQMSSKKNDLLYLAPHDLQPNPWQEEVFLALNGQDEDALRSSIEERGIRDPLVVWHREGKYIILAGMERHRIALELNLSVVPVVLYEYESETEARIFALTDNLARRHLTAGQRAYLALQLQRVLSVGSGARTDLTESSQVDAGETAAKRAGVSTGSVSAMQAVLASGNKELLEEVLGGKTALNAAARRVKRKEGGRATSSAETAPFTASELDAVASGVRNIVSAFETTPTPRTVPLIVATVKDMYRAMGGKWDRLDQALERTIRATADDASHPSTQSLPIDTSEDEYVELH